MSALTYEEIALQWQPEKKRDHQFLLLAILILAVSLSAAFYMSTIDVPKKARDARTVVPERVARFIMQKEKPRPKPVVKPKPRPKPKPIVKKTVRPKPESKKPLTKTQKKARKKAEQSGLLALGNELADLMDTSDINAMVGKRVSASGQSTQAATVNKDVLTADAGKGSGGVAEGKYATSVSSTNLSERERLAVRQSLGRSSAAEGRKATGSKSGKGRRGDNVRAEEEVTFVMDQNKSKLYSLYRRASRKNPGLKGKIVLEITIAPSGKVTRVRIKSSELNDPRLERQLVSRIKQFNFGAGNVEPVTVTFPIEFLPS